MTLQEKSPMPTDTYTYMFNLVQVKPKKNFYLQIFIIGEIQDLYLQLFGAGKTQYKKNSTYTNSECM